MNLFMFDESALVHKAPTYLVPVYCWLTRKLGAQRVLRFFARVPAKRKRLGLCIFGKEACVLSPDRWHCLLSKPEWHCWAVYRATTDLQRYSWHGITLNKGDYYISPRLEERL